MDKKLKAFLRDGETVEWGSRPEPVELLDADNGNRIVKRWSLTVLITLALLSVYVGYYEVNGKLVVLIVGIALYNMVAPLLEARDISKHQSYYITNQRVILGGKDSAFYHMELAEIDEMKVVVGLSGRKSLVLGSSIFEKCERQMRWLTLHPKDDPSPSAVKDHVIGMTFYEPQNAAGACALLQGRTQVRQSNCAAKTKGAKSAA